MPATRLSGTCSTTTGFSGGACTVVSATCRGCTSAKTSGGSGFFFQVMRKGSWWYLPVIAAATCFFPAPPAAAGCCPPARAPPPGMLLPGIPPGITPPGPPLPMPMGIVGGVIVGVVGAVVVVPLSEEDCPPPQPARRMNPRPSRVALPRDDPNPNWPLLFISVFPTLLYTFFI